MTAMHLPSIHHYVLLDRPDLIAGEYPGHPDRGEAIARLRLLRHAGVSFFIDLTEEGELEPYDLLFDQIDVDGRPAAIHRRFPIRDARVPQATQLMVEILDAIDQAILEGHRVYLHCWGGIGRTGTVAGCYLVRRGAGGEEALATIARLFAKTEKGRRGRVSPETETQAEYVRRWEVAGPAIDGQPT